MLEYVRMRRTPDILRLGNTLAQGTDAIFLEFIIAQFDFLTS